MSEDMPWVIGLTDEEVQELRKNKQELTQYGKEKIRELMNDNKLRFYDKGKETFAVDGSSWGKIQTPEMKLELKEMTHEEMLEVAAKREAENKAALESLGIDYENFGQKPWDESMLEEVELTEKENQVLEIAKNFIGEHSDAMKQLARIEHQELAAELALELRSWAQNEEMVDQYFTKHGIICNQAADLLELLVK
jgi:hypothetical protein